jgi:hypothetical protein
MSDLGKVEFKLPSVDLRIMLFGHSGVYETKIWGWKVGRCGRGNQATKRRLQETAWCMMKV